MKARRYARSDAAKKAKAELKVYGQLFAHAEAELQLLQAENLTLKNQLAERAEHIRSLASDVEATRMISGARSAAAQPQGAVTRDTIREYLPKLAAGTLTIRQAVELAQHLFPDRLVFLESAHSSAKEADRAGSRNGMKAIELLSKLATGYFEALSSGHGDLQGKTVFGQNYSQNAGTIVTSAGRRRLIFSHRGEAMLMEMHLKSGNKDSKAETLRIHYAWSARESLIIVGHCGKHIDP